MTLVADRLLKDSGDLIYLTMAVGSFGISVCFLLAVVVGVVFAAVAFIKELMGWF